MPRISNNPSVGSYSHVGQQAMPSVADNAVGQSVRASLSQLPGTAKEAHPLSERSASLTTKPPGTISSGGNSIPLSKQLQHAVKEGNLDTLRALHNDGLDIAAQTVTGFMTVFNPLACAAENKNLETFRFLAQATRQPLANPGQLAQLTFSLITSDQVDYLEVLHSNGLLHEVITRDLIDGDGYSTVDSDNEPDLIPMLNLAIICDSQEVFKWLLRKEFDPTKTGISMLSPKVRRNCNAFDHAAMRLDGRMMEQLLIHVSKTAKPPVLPETCWLQAMAKFYQRDDGFKQVLALLPNFYNCQELVDTLIDEAYRAHNIILLTDLIDTFGEKPFAEKKLAYNFVMGVKNKDPELILYLIYSGNRDVEVEKLLQFISTLPDSAQLLDCVLQRLNDTVPFNILDLILQSRLENCVNREPQLLSRSAKCWTLITALIRHGAKANPPYMLSYAVITGNMELLQESLNEVQESEQLKDRLTTMAENLACHYHYAKSLEVLMLLIDKGADPASVMRKMMLKRRKHNELSERDFSIMKSLLEKDERLVDLIIDKQKGESLLEFTLSNQFFREAEFLIQSGADISQPTSFNLTFKEAASDELTKAIGKGITTVFKWQQILSLLKNREATENKARQ